MKLTTFFISKTKQIYSKTLTVPESTFKIKAMILWIYFEIVLTSAFIWNKIFTWKRDGAISSKLQGSRPLSGPF